MSMYEVLGNVVHVLGEKYEFSLDLDANERELTAHWRIYEIRDLLSCGSGSVGAYVIIFDGHDTLAPKRINVTPQGFYRNGDTIPDVTVLQYFLAYPHVGFALP